MSKPINYNEQAAKRSVKRTPIEAYYNRVCKRIDENIMELKRQETEHIRLMEMDAAVVLQRERVMLLITKDLLKEELTNKLSQ